MQIIYNQITELIPAEYNPRQATKKQIEDVRRSLETFGFVDPVIVNTHPDRENIIVGGHLRVKVWGEMGNDKVPTVAVKLDLTKEKELNIRLNKNTGEWDWDLLANEFELDDLLQWGFSETEFSISQPDSPKVPNPPDDFKEYDAEIETDYKCPKCGYAWSGDQR